MGSGGVVGVSLRTRWFRLSATYRRPDPSSARPHGACSRAAAAKPPSPSKPASPVPAMVWMVPSAVTFRMAWLPVSAMYRLPSPSTARPRGAFRSAFAAGPPSPEYPGAPAPANVEIAPPGANRRMRWFRASAMYRLPAASKARAEGFRSCACGPGPPSPEYPAEALPAAVVGCSRRVHYQHAAEEGIGDIEAAAPVGQRRPRPVQGHQVGRQSIASQTPAAASGRRPDGSAGRNAAYAAVSGVRHQQVAAGVRGHAGGRAYLGQHGRAAVAAEARLARAGRGGDFFPCRHLADAVRAAVRDEEVSGDIQGHAPGGMQGGLDGGAVVPDVGGEGVPGHRGDCAGGAHLADSQAVGDVEVPGAVQRHVRGRQQQGRGGPAPVAVVAPKARARHALGLPRRAEPAHHGDPLRHVQVSGGVQRQPHGGLQDHAAAHPADPGGDHAVRPHPPDAVVLGIGDVERAGGVHRQPGGEGQLRPHRRAAVAAEPGNPQPRHGRDRAVAGDLAHPVAFELGDVQVARGVQGEVARRHEFRLHGRPSVAPGAHAAGSGQRADHAVDADPPHPVVAQVRDVDVALGIHRHGVRQVEAGLFRRSAVAARAGLAVSGHGGDHARRRDLADAVVLRVGDVQVALAVRCDALRHPKLRGDGLPAVARAAASGHRLDDVVEGAGGGGSGRGARRRGGRQEGPAQKIRKTSHRE
jgi:hypothetical protein